MIASDDLQASIITRLKANTALIAFLTTYAAQNEVRETQWQGAAFVYPAVRVSIGTQNPIGDGVCYLTNSEVTFTVHSFSESDSSQQADDLAGLVNTALMGGRLAGTGFGSLVIQSDGLVHAVRTVGRVWQAQGLYRTFIYGS